MSLKQNLVSVDDVSVLSGTQVSKLKHAHVTTAEELAGQLDADPVGIADLLDIDVSDVKKLKTQVLTTLSPETRSDFAERSGRRYSYGALNPREK